MTQTSTPISVSYPTKRILRSPWGHRSLGILTILNEDPIHKASQVDDWQRYFHDVGADCSAHVQILVIFLSKEIKTYEI